MAVLDLTPTTKVRAIWFVTDRETMDWMACVLQPDGGQWEIRHRIRQYHNGPRDPWDGKDRKESVVLRSDGTPDVEKMVEAVNLMGKIVQVEHLCEYAVRLDVNGDGVKALELLRLQPWFHVKEVVLPPGGSKENPS